MHVFNGNNAQYKFYKMSAIKYPRINAKELRIATTGTDYKNPNFHFTGLDVNGNPAKITIRMNDKSLGKLVWRYVTSKMRGEIYDMMERWLKKEDDIN